MRNIGRIDTKSIARQVGLHKIQLVKRKWEYYIMAYTDPDDEIGDLIGLLMPYEFSDGSKPTMIQAFYPRGSGKRDVSSVEEGILIAAKGYVKQIRG